MHTALLILVSLLAPAPFFAQQEGSVEAQPNLTIEVTRWADGQPLAGQRAAVKIGGRLHEVQLDKSGKCELALAEGEPFLVTVLATSETRRVHHQVGFPLQPSEHRAIQLLAYPRSLAVRGRVVDLDGVPVSGASVSAITERFDAKPVEIATDSNGDFEFEGLTIPQNLGERAEAWILSASGAGVRSNCRVRLALEDLGANVTGLQFVLEPTSELTGVVLDAQGQPAQSAEVSIEANSETRFFYREIERGVGEIPQTPSDGAVYTSKDGRFVFTDYRPENCTVTAMQEFSSDARRHRIDPSDRELRFSFEPEPVRDPDLIELRGVVVDSFGQPLQGVNLNFHRWEIETVPTDAAGEFRVELIRPQLGDANLTFRLVGYAAHRVEIRHSIDEPNLGVITLKPGKAISGKISRFGNEQIAGLAVRALPLDLLESGTFIDQWYRRTFQTGAGNDGTFELSGLWEGTWQVRVEDGPRVLAQVTVEAGDREVEIHLGGVSESDVGPVAVVGDGMATLHGRLLDSVTHLPIAGATIAPSAGKGMRYAGRVDPAPVISEQDGTFRFNSLMFGDWALRISADGYATEFANPIEVSADAPGLELSLGREASRRVWVFDETGQRLHDVSVEVVGVNGRYLPGPDPAFPVPFGLIGRWDDAVLGIPMGDVIFHILPRGTTQSVPFSMRIEGGSTEPIEIHLKGDFSTPRQELQVTVRDALGDSLKESFSLTATDKNGTSIARWEVRFYQDQFAVTTEEEMLGFLHPPPERSADSIIPFKLPPGSHTLSLEGEGWTQQGPEVTIVAGQSAEPVTIVVERHDSADSD